MNNKKQPITFTLPELRRQLNKQSNRDITDEEIEATVLLLEHLGHIKRISKDLWSTTGKELPLRR